MRFPLLPVLIMLLINCGIDWYIYRSMLRRLKDKMWPKIHLIASALFTIAFIVVIALPKREGGDDGFLKIMWAIYAYFSIYIPKLIFFLADLCGRLPRLWHRKALRWPGTAGAAAGVFVFMLMWWGALIDSHSIDINEVNYSNAAVPPAFDGFRIVQLSDLHTGTYGHDTSFVDHVVDEVNALKPDMVVFSGDIVNRHTPELLPFVESLAKLHAPYGVWAILGNHDYGDYYNWPDAASKQRNMEQLYDLNKRMGWRLMLNESAPIVRGTDTLMLIGVENVGDPPFKNYGDLAKAYPTLGDDKFKILLSHNPAHWSEAIRDHADARVPLTLSGHTHAMQMKIGRWSPAVWRYSTWGGMYTDSIGHSLYVNIGLGEVGIPARIGATPEITLITLHRSK